MPSDTKIRIPSSGTVKWSKGKEIMICIGKKVKPLTPIEICETARDLSFTDLSSTQTVLRTAAYLTWDGFGFLTRSNSPPGSLYARSAEAKEYIHYLCNSKAAQAKEELRKILKPKPSYHLVHDYLIREPENQGTIEGLADIIRKQFNSNSTKEIKEIWRFKSAAIFWCNALSDAGLIEYAKKEGIIRLEVQERAEDLPDENETNAGQEILPETEEINDHEDEQTTVNAKGPSLLYNINIDIKVSDNEQLQHILQHLENALKFSTKVEITEDLNYHCPPLNSGDIEQETI